MSRTAPEPRPDTDPYIVHSLATIGAHVDSNREKVVEVRGDVKEVKKKLYEHIDEHKEFNGDMLDLVEAIKSINPDISIAKKGKPITFEWLVNKFWMPIAIGVIMLVIQLMFN
jgi:hypothetical protein